MTYKILGSDQKEYGPVSQEDLRRWIQEQRVDGNSLIQAEGETEWKALRTFGEFGDLIRDQPTASSARPPAPPIVPSVTDAAAYSLQILGNPIRIDVMHCIRRSWDLYKANFSLIFPTTLVIFIAASAAGAIPWFGFIINLVLNGVFYGGLYWFFLKVIRGEKAELMDSFAGFSRFFQQLMLGGAVINILSLFAICLAGIPFLLSFIPAMISLSDNPSANPDAILGAFGFIGVLSVLFMILVAFFVYAMWMFALPLIVDKGLDFWPAMELSRKVFLKDWRNLLLLLILCGLIAMSGILLCVIGVFFTAPIAIGAVTYAYEDIFGSTT